MIGLSEIHARRAADTANLCRELSRNIPLPTIMVRNKLAVSVGTDGTVFFYEFDGWNIYLAQFIVGPDGKIGWVSNDISNSPTVLAPMIDAYFALLFLSNDRRGENPFHHWCSIDCWLQHDMLPHS